MIIFTGAVSAVVVKNPGRIATGEERYGPSNGIFGPYGAV